MVQDAEFKVRSAGSRVQVKKITKMIVNEMEKDTEITLIIGKGYMMM